ncbi:hypothetical protein GQ53DRAFT_734671 [Thozetella sp. PMI_491]|nr:hypothetical protein GQ53DRAFT_734671 [Thozetella sp. PMI_491]
MDRLAEIIDLSRQDEEDDSDEGDTPNDSEDLDAIRPGVYQLGLNINYVNRWSRGDAFREFYQNWKDAIIESFNLDPRNPAAFNPIRNETETQIQITVHREVESPNSSPRRKELLGYILLNKSAGRLELTNFSAKLETQHLSLGGTEKWRNKNLAGTHGEGFKLAALVMRRYNYRVHISASSFYWNFGFSGNRRDRFHCRLSQPSPRTIQKSKEEFAKNAPLGPREALTSYIWKDVTVLIEKPKGLLARSVTKEDFDTWAAVSLDLSGPAPDKIIRTEHGDLILDTAFANQVGKDYVFGYNFVEGDINRDRQRLSHPAQEAAMIAKIWQHPILENREDVVRSYIDLFKDPRDVPDIAFAEKVVSEPVAKAIWSFMKAENPDTFFYCVTTDERSPDDIDQASLILTTIKKRPEALSKNLWRTLRRWSLVRTAQEERVRLFAGSEPAQVPDNIFSLSVFRMLQGALQLDKKLEQIQLRIVKGGGTGIDLLYEEEERQLLIHNRWLDFEQVHENSSCEASRLAKEKPLATIQFSCDHVVEELFELIVQDLVKALKLDYAEGIAIRRHARERIPQMPRAIEISKAAEGGALVVSWRGNECGVLADTYGADILYDVTLHKWRTCFHKHGDLVQRVGMSRH